MKLTGRACTFRTHKSLRPSSFPVTSCSMLNLCWGAEWCSPLELNVYAYIGQEIIIMSNIAIKRVQREFKEVINSEEVRGFCN